MSPDDGLAVPTHESHGRAGCAPTCSPTRRSHAGTGWCCAGCRNDVVFAGAHCSADGGSSVVVVLPGHHLQVLARLLRAAILPGNGGSVTPPGQKVLAMTADHVRDLFRRFAEAMNSRELEQLDDILTDDFTRHCEVTPDLVIDSREDFNEFLLTFALASPDNVQTSSRSSRATRSGSGRPTRAPRRKTSGPRRAAGRPPPRSPASPDSARTGSPSCGRPGTT